MANRLESHYYFDGEFWSIYTERAADIRRFEEWFGKPTRESRPGASGEGTCAAWSGIPGNDLRLRRRRKGGKAPSPLALEGLKRHREALKRKGSSSPDPKLGTSGA